MKSPIIIYFLLFSTIDIVIGISNLLNTSVHTCIACVCHATTGCYSLKNCANYSINYQYWEVAGAPTLTADGEVNEEMYLKCMTDDNCIINTIYKYIYMHRRPDCNCDDQYDCRDELSLHLLRGNCKPMKSMAHRYRYNRCAINRSLPRLGANLECSNAAP
ncbi:hypothetical protein Trydic_g3115 [Trypoxylus dichotomus]